MNLLLTLAGLAQASSLDLIEVGGAFGTPAADDAAATYWNPAGLAAGKGTSIVGEIAPSFASLSLDLTGNGPWNGKDTLDFNGPAPFFAVATDFGHDPLGVGISLAVPIARGGTSRFNLPKGSVGPGGGAARTALRDGGTQLVDITAAASYQIKKVVSFGAGFHYMLSQWKAQVDTETLTALNDQLCEFGQCDNYTDDQILDPNYGAELVFHDLKDTAMTFSAGTYVTPIPQLAISASYIHWADVVHTGPVTANFGCPPEEDTLGRFGSEFKGVCDATLTGDSTVSYGLPWRANWGVRVMPLDTQEKLQLELMGSIIGWERYVDYNITTDIDPDSVDLDDEEARIETAGLASQNRQWARDNHTSWWLGVDAKGRLLNERLLVGGRVTFDKSAIPDKAISGNNIDLNEIILMGLVGGRPVKWLELGASYSYHAMLTRTVTDSGFGMSLATAPEDRGRYFYANANGTYSGHIHRLGFTARFLFNNDTLGKKGPKRIGGDPPVPIGSGDAYPDEKVAPPKGATLACQDPAEIERLMALGYYTPGGADVPPACPPGPGAGPAPAPAPAPSPAPEAVPAPAPAPVP